MIADSGKGAATPLLQLMLSNKWGTSNDNASNNVILLVVDDCFLVLTAAG
jgi:hypothetical protein